MTKRFESTGQWIVGIKKLIDNYEILRKPVQQVAPPMNPGGITNQKPSAPSANFVNPAQVDQMRPSLPPPPVSVRPAQVINAAAYPSSTPPIPSHSFNQANPPPRFPPTSMRPPPVASYRAPPPPTQIRPPGPRPPRQ